MYILLRAKILKIKYLILVTELLILHTTLDARINEIKSETPSITNLATPTASTAVENKKPDHSKYITSPEFNKITA